MIHFSDNVKWIARIPGSGVSSFGPLEARKLLTDIQTTTLIRSTTSIPVPEVFAWDVTTDNPVGVPYHFELFMEGTTLSERWADSSWSTEAKRISTLSNLVRAMSKLRAFRFNKVGSLLFDADRGFSHVSDMVKVDRDMLKMMDGEEV